MSVFFYEDIETALQKGYEEMSEINLLISNEYFCIEVEASHLYDKNIKSKRWCLDEKRRNLSSQS